ncbi:hypothetical protein ACOSP7_018553 [Xanthoceras sorbifolium]
MSQVISNLSISLPRIHHLFTPNYGNFRHNNLSCIKAQASGESSKDNLDHLQRATKLHQTQQSKKRATPVAAPIGLWDRFPTARTVQQMMETMERMMEDPFVYSGTWPSESAGSTGGYNRRGRTPWEIKEGENEYKMRFDMPGMTKGDVKMWVDQEKMLVVKAEKVPNKKQNGQENNNGGVAADVEEEEEEWSSKSYGRYSSRIALPENVNFEKIKAEIKDGVLYITIPKASSNNGRVFDINVQ